MANIHIKLLILLSMALILIFSCTSIEKVKNGEQAMDRKQYAVAQELLLNEYENAKRSEKAYISYLLGDAFSLTNHKSQSLKWYQESYQRGYKTPQSLWKLALSLKQNGHYSKAIEIFELVEKSDDSKLINEAKRESRICLQAIDWKNRVSKFDIAKLPVRENASVYFSDILSDGRLVITSDHKTIQNKKTYKWTGRQFSQTYLLYPESDGQLNIPDGWTKSNYHAGGATFNKPFNELIYTLCNKDNPEENHCKLVISKKINGQWSQPVILAFVKDGINYGHPYIHRDSLLFFSSNDPSGMGKYDIYFSKKEHGNWSQASLLPAPINTPGNEKFPTAIDDSLFFSSDYHPGLGGLDIFKVFPRADGQWSAPINLHSPFNSPLDDFGYQKDPSLNDSKFFINSSRGKPESLDKIFIITPSQVEELVIESNDINTQKKEFKLFLSLKVFEKVYEKPDDPNSKIIGKKPIPLFEGKFISGDNKGFQGRQDGRYISEIEFSRDYKISIYKDGFLNNIIHIPQTNLPGSSSAKEIQTINIEAELKRPFFNKEIVLQNIYYDLDKWDIRNDAEPILFELAQLLNANPDLRVHIGSHTDCRADNEYNLELSRKRASSVVEYLINMEVNEVRLSFEGFGKSRLIEDCNCEDCTERQHQKNRRTTFTLIK